MNTINPVTTSASSPGQSNATATSTQQNSKGLASDFETFLKMLTAQARHQDPLEPIDSTEYAAQLAQFSMVEQQVQSNDTLTALLDQMATSNMASLAGWVGMEARAESPMYFDGTPITISPNPAKTADQAFLVVKNSDGQEVQRQAISIANDSVQWAGVDDGGAPFANGIYSFEVESLSDGQPVPSGATEVYGRITEAQTQGNSVVLVMQGGVTVPANAVSALRNP